MSHPSCKLILLGGPPGVGKTTLIRSKLTNVLTCLEADNITDPKENIPQNQAIDKVIKVVEKHLVSSHNVLVSWVFAKPELYKPFTTHFSPAVSVQQIYLTASETEISKRLTSRKDAALISYSLGKLALINASSFAKIDTSEKKQEDIFRELLAIIDLPLSH